MKVTAQDVGRHVVFSDSNYDADTDDIIDEAWEGRIEGIRPNGEIDFHVTATGELWRALPEELHEEHEPGMSPLNRKTPRRAE